MSITNSVVIFAALELSGFTTFESGSLVYTSAIVLLPLGSLIAQAMARPDGYVQRSNTSGASAGSGPSGRQGSNGIGGSNGGHSGAYSRAATNTINTVDSKTGIMHHHSNSTSKNNADFGTWSHASDANSTNAMIAGGIATQVRIQSNQSGFGLPNSGLPSPGLPGSRTRNNSLAVVDPIEKQLQEIDATPLSTNDGRVWVDREVEVRRDMV